MQAKEEQNERDGHNQKQQPPPHPQREENHHPGEYIAEMRELHRSVAKEPARISICGHKQNHSDERSPQHNSAPT
jgi:hypothetical protein